MEPSIESHRHLRLLSGGIRILQLRPNGEMDRVVQQSGLVPRKPFQLSSITILPGPSSEYQHTPCDVDVPESRFRHQLLSLDLEHEITKVFAFAACQHGTPTLTPEAFQGCERLFTVYYFCNLRVGGQVVIRARPDFLVLNDIEDNFLLLAK